MQAINFSDHVLKAVDLIPTQPVRSVTPPQNSEDRATHERAYYVELTRKMLGNNLNGKPYTFGQVLGMTKDWSISQLRDRFFYCSKRDKPPVVWFGMRKKDKELSTV